jgi:hypothetical protein
VLRRRTFLSGLAVVLHPALVGPVKFSNPPFAGTSSYFDDDDADLLPLVTGRVPIVTVEILTHAPVPGVRDEGEALEAHRIGVVLVDRAAFPPVRSTLSCTTMPSTEDRRRATHAIKVNGG